MATVEAPRTFSPLTQELGEKIVGLTLKEAKELSDYLEEVHGIKPAAGGAVMMAAPAEGAGAAAAAAAEKTEFDVVVEAYGDGKKIGVIKVVRAATSLGPERGQGPGRGRAGQGQGRTLEGRRRKAEERIGRGRRYRCHQVASDIPRILIFSPKDLPGQGRTGVLRGQKRFHLCDISHRPEGRSRSRRARTRRETDFGDFFPSRVRSGR